MIFRNGDPEEIHDPDIQFDRLAVSAPVLQFQFQGFSEFRAVEGIAHIPLKCFELDMFLRSKRKPFLCQSQRADLLAFRKDDLQFIPVLEFDEIRLRGTHPVFDRGC